jgi:hypothetical protein
LYRDSGDPRRQKVDRSLEDAAENMPARMPARPAENPRHERVFIAFGGPTRSTH